MLPSSDVFKIKTALSQTPDRILEITYSLFMSLVHPLHFSQWCGKSDHIPHLDLLLCFSQCEGLFQVMG